jgi:thiol-disulfide isomerase/thioredoxin
VVVLAATPLRAAESALTASAAQMEHDLRESAKIPADFKFVYQSANGTSLTAEQFVEKALQGAQFDVARADAHKTVTLKMKPLSSQGEVGAVTQLPGFNLPRLGGGRARSEDLKGRVSLVNFFFETCVPCIKEAPMLSAFRHKHPEFNYLAVTHDSSVEAQRFVEQRKLDWPVAIEGGTLLAATQVRGFPTYLLVAADGRIMGRGAGMEMNAMNDPARALADFEKWVKQRLGQ